MSEPSVEPAGPIKPASAQDGIAAAVDPATLPVDRERRLHPWSWLFVLMSQLRQFFLPLLVLVVFGGRSDGWYQLTGAGVLIVFVGFSSVWRYFTFRYRVGSDSIFVRSGLLHRELRQIPYSRIHDVAVHQSLLHRLFGVAEVRLESAGGNKPEATMQVLALEQALALEQLIRTRGQDTAAGTADAATTPASAGDTLLALPVAEVVRLGLISNRGMVVVAGAVALAFQLLPDDLAGNQIARSARQVFGYTSALGADWIAQAIAVSALIVLALTLIRLLSVALALVQYYGFRLSEQGRRLTAERGLFTRRRNSVPRRRIQAWTLKETLLHRLFRRRSLHIDTAVVGQANEVRGLSELAPIATADTCDRLARHIIGATAWPPAQWQGLHRSMWLRLVLGDLLVTALATAVAVRFLGMWGWGLLLWLPIALLIARQHARRAGYAINGTLVAVRQGWWSRTWRFAEIDKLQALQLQRSPLDRAFGTASLWLDTAGAGAMSPSLRLPYLPMARAQAVFDDLNRAVAARPLRW